MSKAPSGLGGEQVEGRRAVLELLRAGRVGVVGSGRSSVEEQFLARKLAVATGAPAWLVARVGEGDGLLLSADRNPNVRGALVTELIAGLPAARLDDLAAKIDAGEVRTVLSLGEDLVPAGIDADRLARVAVIYVGTHANATSAAARVVIPALSVFEKAGTFINQQFRIQKFAPAVPGPSGVADDRATLAGLVAAAGGPVLAADIDAIWAAIAAEVKSLETVSYANLPAGGLVIDGSAFAGLPFPEGQSLHFKPTEKRESASA